MTNASSSKINLIELDDNFQKGISTFTFENEDKYEGEYCAHRSGVVWREGIGTYTTKDGQTYTGEWVDDKLVENKEIEVVFPSGTKYYGNIVKNQYEGDGMYVVDDMCLLSQFHENKPIGEIILVDVKGKEWHGMATENEALLLPEHVYFNNINKDRGKGRVKKTQELVMQRSISFKQLDKTMSEMKSKASLDKEIMKQLEKQIFAKTKKTASDLQFQESDWYKNYVNFKKVYEDIDNKIKENGENSLDEKELLWHKKYNDFKNKYLEIIDARKQNKKKLSDHKLFELYNSDEYKNSCPPIPVFYPTEKSSSEGLNNENLEESEKETENIPVLPQS